MPKRIILFIWKLCYQGLPLKHVLHQKNIIDNQICPLYYIHLESAIAHVFFQREFAQAMWFGSKLSIGQSLIHPQDVTYQTKTCLTQNQINQADFDNQLTIPICYMFYAIWVVRNKVVFIRITHLIPQKQMAL